MAVAAMKIGILGSGVVGQALGTGFATLGHDVKIGTRRPEDDKLKLWVRQTGAKGSVASPGEAARFAEVAVLATAWSGTENAIRLADPKNLYTAQNVLPLLNSSKASENVKSILDAVSAKLTTDDLVQMNKKAAVEKTDPDVLAAQWLRDHGFTK